jgi:hypothetical protein
VAQGIGLKSKPQYHKTNKQTNKQKKIPQLLEPHMVVHACNLSTQEAEQENLEFEVRPQLCLKKNQTKPNNETKHTIA